MTTTRTIEAIAREAQADWSTRGNGVNYAAMPYLQAMHDLQSVNDTYGQDSGASIVRYFLANAGSWRGDVARRVKAELRAML